MKRRLASVQKVLAIDPIPDADNIERITINGWTVVSQKGNFKVGDFGVFYEIDSVPPDIDLYQFLWVQKVKDENKVPTGEIRIVPRPENYHLESVRLRGCLSQGLMLPLREVVEQHLGWDEWTVLGLKWMADHPDVTGLDLTDALGIDHWEKRIPDSGTEDGPWSFAHTGVSKTDEERVQSRLELLQQMKGLPYYIAEKADGRSVSVGYDIDGVFRVNGRNWSLKPGENAAWTAVSDAGLSDKLNQMGSFVLQGELCGPGIENNRLGLKRPTWYMFDAFDTASGVYVGYKQLVEIAHTWDISMVKVDSVGAAFDLELDQLLMMAEGIYEGTKNKREGIVVRPQETTYSPTLGGRLSFKVVANDYLLANKSKR